MENQSLNRSLRLKEYTSNVVVSGKLVDFYLPSFRHAPGRKYDLLEYLGNPMLYEQCGRMTGHLHELPNVMTLVGM